MPGMTSLFSVSLCPLVPWQLLPFLFFWLVLSHTELGGVNMCFLCDPCLAPLDTCTTHHSEQEQHDTLQRIHRVSHLGHPGRDVTKGLGDGTVRRMFLAYLVVFAIGVAAAVLGQDAALAIQDVAGVALAALHAVVAAVTLEPDGGASRLAQGHAALVVAVGRTADGCNVQGEHEGCGLAPWRKLTSPTSSLHHWLMAASHHLMGSTQTTRLGHAHSAQTLAALWHWLLLTLGLEDSSAHRGLAGSQPTYGAPVPSARVHTPGDMLLPAGLHSLAIRPQNLGVAAHPKVPPAHWG